MQKRPSVSCFVLKELLRIAKHRGVDTEQLLGEFSLHAGLLADIDARVPLETISLMHERVAGLLDDPMFGLYKGLNSSLFSLGPIMNIIMNSPNLKTALELSIRYIKLFSEEFDFEIIYEGELFGLVFKPNPIEQVSYHQVYSAMGHTISLMRWLYGADFNVPRITFTTPPKGKISDYIRVIGATPVFNAPANVLYGPQQLLNKELPWNGDLAAVLEDVDKEYNQAFKSDTIEERVSKIIRSKVFIHTLGIAMVAKELRMSPRTLQRRLMEDGVNYRKLVDDVKKEAAFTLLTSYKYHNKSLTEIAFMLGYCDISKFYKHFKRWSGMSPGKFREQNSNQAGTE